MSMVTPQHQMCPHCSQNNMLSARYCIQCGKPLSNVPLLPKNFLLANRYRVVSVLGCGGFGAVYLALDTRFQKRKVAIKELLLADPSAVKQFENEARLLSSLSHPSLPKVTDWFREPMLDRRYLVMDFIEGFNLWEVVRKRGVLTQRQAIRLMDPILDAVVYLHTQNPPIIHRDIKPHNIIVVLGKNAVYLVDFGIAKVGAAGQRTATGVRGVSPGFSPLEQYTGGTDERSDIYSLGATFYYLLTGKVPPEATERIQKEMAGQLSLEPIRPVNSSVAPWFEAAVFQAMAMHKEQRFKSIFEFRAALEGKTTLVQPSGQVHQTSLASQPAPVAFSSSQAAILTEGAGRAVQPTRSQLPLQPQVIKELLPYGFGVALIIVGSLGTWVGVSPQMQFFGIEVSFSFNVSGVDATSFRWGIWTLLLSLASLWLVVWSLFSGEKPQYHSIIASIGAACLAIVGGFVAYYINLLPFSVFSYGIYFIVFGSMILLVYGLLCLHRSSLFKQVPKTATILILGLCTVVLLSWAIGRAQKKALINAEGVPVPNVAQLQLPQLEPPETVAVTVNGWWETDSLQGGLFGRLIQKPGKKFVIVNITVTNQGQGETWITADDFELIGSDRNVYNAYSSWFISDTRVNLISAHLLPGGSATGDVVFEIPEGVEPKSIRYGRYSGW